MVSESSFEGVVQIKTVLLREFNWQILSFIKTEKEFIDVDERDKGNPVPIIVNNWPPFILPFL